MAFIQINKQNFFHNLNQIALQTGAVDKIAIVLKDNAYGHGLELMAKLSSEFGIKHAVVRNTDEAEKITSYFESILVLGDTIVKHETFSYAVNSLDDIQKAPKGARVELKVDTGMHRNGIGITQLDEALTLIKEKALELVGVMTHYRSADEMGSSFFWQTKQFENVQKRIIASGFTHIRFHSHNSAAILRNKSFTDDLIRVGIAAYGYNELSKPFDKITLNPILSLYAKKLSTRVLHKGQRVGYGGDFIATKEMKVSTYDIGYGDGWCRAGGGTAFITAEKLPILGRVSMDFVTLQSDKEEVCIMYDAQEAAKQLNTISYEITTALHEKLERTVK